MAKHIKNGYCYSPLYIHSFQFLIPHNLTKAEAFFLQYPDVSKINNTADKLIYYRYKNAMLQNEVAKHSGMDRKTYACYENGIDFYHIDKLSKIAELYQLDVTELLDEYNRFLYNGQGMSLKTLRKAMRMTQLDLAKLMNVSQGTIKRWEGGKVRITKPNYEKLLELGISKIYD